jgi:hypothetical protein
MAGKIGKLSDGAGILGVVRLIRPGYHLHIPSWLYQKSFAYAKSALALQPDNERLKKNLEAISAKLKPRQNEVK